MSQAVPVLALLVLLAMAPPTAAQPVVRDVAIMTCGVARPASVAEWRQRADAIVRVRLDSQRTYDYEVPTTTSSDVLTAHEAAVLHLFKPHPQVPAAGMSITIVQRGGIMAREDGLYRFRWNDFDIMPAGTEWVLFLYWNKHFHAFEVLHFEDGAFQIQGEMIATRGRNRFASRWSGKAASAFLAALDRDR